MVGEEQKYDRGVNKLVDVQNLDSIALSAKQVPWKVIICGLIVGSLFASAPFAVLYLISLMTSPSRLVTYIDNDNGIEIKRPLDWEVRRINNSFIGDIVQFISPKALGDNFREAVTISVEKFSGTFKQYTQSELQDIRLHLKSASINTQNTSTLDGHQASEMVYTAKEGSKTTKYWKKSTLDNKQIYTITYAANVVDYNKYFPTVKQMAETFHININNINTKSHKHRAEAGKK